MLRSAVFGNDLSLLLPLIVYPHRSAFGIAAHAVMDYHNVANMLHLSIQAHLKSCSGLSGKKNFRLVFKERLRENSRKGYVAMAKNRAAERFQELEKVSGATGHDLVEFGTNHLN